MLVLSCIVVNILVDQEHTKTVSDTLPFALSLTLSTPPPSLSVSHTHFHPKNGVEEEWNELLTASWIKPHSTRRKRSQIELTWYTIYRKIQMPKVLMIFQLILFIQFLLRTKCIARYTNRAKTTPYTYKADAMVSSNQRLTKNNNNIHTLPQQTSLCSCVVICIISDGCLEPHTHKKPSEGIKENSLVYFLITLLFGVLYLWVKWLPAMK